MLLLPTPGSLVLKWWYSCQLQNYASSALICSNKTNAHILSHNALTARAWTLRLLKSCCPGRGRRERRQMKQQKLPGEITKLVDVSKVYISVLFLLSKYFSDEYDRWHFKDICKLRYTLSSILISELWNVY